MYLFDFDLFDSLAESFELAVLDEAAGSKRDEEDSQVDGQSDLEMSLPLAAPRVVVGFNAFARGVELRIGAATRVVAVGVLVACVPKILGH